MTWLASGLASMLVPGVAAGGGVGLSLLNRGWIWASLTAGLGGLEVSKVNLGGGGKSSMLSSMGKGPSSARAGLAGRLPGIGSRAVPRDSALCVRG